MTGIAPGARGIRADAAVELHRVLQREQLALGNLADVLVSCTIEHDSSFAPVRRDGGLKDSVLTYQGTGLTNTGRRVSRTDLDIVVADNFGPKRQLFHDHVTKLVRRGQRHLHAELVDQGVELSLIHISEHTRPY